MVRGYRTWLATLVVAGVLGIIGVLRAAPDGAAIAEASGGVEVKAPIVAADAGDTVAAATAAATREIESAPRAGFSTEVALRDAWDAFAEVVTDVAERIGSEAQSIADRATERIDGPTLAGTEGPTLEAAAPIAQGEPAGPTLLALVTMRAMEAVPTARIAPGSGTVAFVFSGCLQVAGADGRTLFARPIAVEGPTLRWAGEDRLEIARADGSVAFSIAFGL